MIDKYQANEAVETCKNLIDAEVLSPKYSQAIYNLYSFVEESGEKLDSADSMREGLEEARDEIRELEDALSRLESKLDDALSAVYDLQSAAGTITDGLDKIEEGLDA
jgi:predicted nuclease with TOPRIM domain